MKLLNKIKTLIKSKFQTDMETVLDNDLSLYKLPNYHQYMGWDIKWNPYFKIENSDDIYIASWVATTDIDKTSDKICLISFTNGLVIMSDRETGFTGVQSIPVSYSRREYEENGPDRFMAAKISSLVLLKTAISSLYKPDDKKYQWLSLDGEGNTFKREIKKEYIN